MSLASNIISPAFSRAANTYDGVAILQREVATRLLDQLEFVKLSPDTICDLGAGTGFGAELLKNRFSSADIFTADFSFEMLSKIQSKKLTTLNNCTNVYQLGFQANSFDFIFCNLMLQWCEHLPIALYEIMRVLKPGGLLLFSTFGPATLKELRESFSSVDTHTHVHDFLDMARLGDTLLKMQFNDPVMQVEDITMSYEHPRDLLKDLKGLGATNKSETRKKTLMGKQKLHAMLQAYEAFRLDDGTYPATFETVYVHAVKPEGWQPQFVNNEGEVCVPLTSFSS